MCTRQSDSAPLSALHSLAKSERERERVQLRSVSQSRFSCRGAKSNLNSELMQVFADRHSTQMSH